LCLRAFYAFLIASLPTCLVLNIITFALLVKFSLVATNHGTICFYSVIEERETIMQTDFLVIGSGIAGLTYAL